MNLTGRRKTHFEATFHLVRSPRLELTFSKNIAEMPGSEKSDPYCLVVSQGGYFDIVSFCYQDGNIRMFTNGDVPRPESDFVAWALLPDLT